MSESSSAAPASEDLGAELRRASSRRLHELVIAHGHRFDVRHARQALLNPYVTAAVIEELVCNRRLMTRYEVRSAVARHRRTPQTAALRFISGLFWRDLLDIAADMRIAPAVQADFERVNDVLLAAFERLVEKAGAETARMWCEVLERIKRVLDEEEGLTPPKTSG